MAIDGRGVLILGPSGSGKSSLALRLISLGAFLVADDQTDLALEGDVVMARCPPVLAGRIEARGVGILAAPALAQAPVVLVVDLATPETERLPPRRSVALLGQCRDLVLGSQSDHFPASVLCYVRHGRQA